LALTYF
jgi:NAD(P)-dependent dehydrogenase (short-subunit alcohol dehydrogenase family)